MRVLLGSILIALVGPATVLPSQRRFVVDANGGGQYADLPQALAAARDGDVFDVRPGLYTPTTTSAGVRVVGGDGRSLRAGTFTIRGLARSATFAITGFETDVAADRVEFVVDRCDGPVVLQRLVAVSPWPWPFAPVTHRLLVTGSGAVSAHECRWQGNGAVEVGGAGSSLTLTSSTVDGFGAPAGSFVQAYPGLRQTGGRVELVDCTVEGGEGSSLPRVSGGYAAIVSGGTLRAARSSILGGWSHVLISTWREPAMQISAGATVVVDPTVTWTPGGAVAPTTATVPAVSVPSTAVGGVLVPTWSGGLGMPSLLGISLAGPRLGSPWGPIFLDPATTSALHVGPAVVSPPGLTLISTIPPGTAITLQGIVALAGGLEMTNPQTLVVR